jgi:hypothetical protein
VTATRSLRYLAYMILCINVLSGQYEHVCVELLLLVICASIIAVLLTSHRI